MALTIGTAQALFDQGRYAEIARLLDSSREARLTLTSEQRLVLAEAAFRAGDVTRSLEIVAEENKAAASPAVRSQCEIILGLQMRAQAGSEEAETHFRTALRLAREANNSKQAAWAQLHWFRMLAELGDHDKLTSLLRETRQAVSKAGDAHTSAYLHNCMALMEASAGRLHQARRHLQISSNLVLTAPHADLEQINLLSLFVTSFQECRFGEALKSVRSAKGLLGVTGAWRRRSIDNNEAHALLMTGRFDLAVPLLQQLVEEAPPYYAFAALDGLAQVFLATDQLTRCFDALQGVARLTTAHPAAARALSARGVATVQLKLLMRRGLWEEAVTASAEHLAAARQIGDGLLVASLCCLRAEALAGAGRHAEAARALFDADVASSIPSRLGGYYRALGFVLRQAGHPLGQAMFARAKAIWDEQENRYEFIESQPVFKSPLSANTIKPLGKSPSVVNALAAVFSLARSPRLVGRELIGIVETLGCADEVSLIDDETKADGPEPTDVHSVVLGEHRGKPVRLTCRVPADAQQALLLSDILRIGQAAIELEEHREADRNRAALWPDAPAEATTGALFVAESMQSLLATARRIAATNVSVLITGETGTGKEMLARVVHAYSARAKAAFMPFNCTSMPKDMLDSHLFGHRRGSFTGATENFPGIIRGAGSGTLFLDEIGDMGLELQPKLLRFLDSGEVHPIGETHPVRADVRVIAATNADLEMLVSQGRFREDLYYRLAIVRLHLPPLRERRVEIPTFVQHYLEKYAREFGKGDLRMAEETMEYLLLYRWPGNVRQLANEVRRMAALAETSAVLMPEHLSSDIFASRRTLPPSERALTPTEVVVRLDQPMAAAVEHVERTMMLYAMKRCSGRIDETAAMLGVSRKGLYLKRQRFGIDAEHDAQIGAALTQTPH